MVGAGHNRVVRALLRRVVCTPILWSVLERGARSMEAD